MNLSKSTLTGYGIAVVIVLAILNVIFWLVGNPQLHELNVFSAGFVLGMLGMYLAAWLYGYHRWAQPMQRLALSTMVASSQHSARPRTATVIEGYGRWNMGSMSIYHWLFIIFFVAVLSVPIARILTRIGYSKWWTIVYFIPFVNIVGIWILAYSRWPAVDRTGT